MTNFAGNKETTRVGVDIVDDDQRFSLCGVCEEIKPDVYLFDIRPLNQVGLSSRIGTLNRASNQADTVSGRKPVCESCLNILVDVQHRDVVTIKC